MRRRTASPVAVLLAAIVCQCTDPPSDTGGGWRAGHCGTTFDGQGKRCAKSDTKGSWPSTSLESCLSRCMRCMRCRFVSFSARFQDCSWYHSCGRPALEQAAGTGHLTRRVRTSGDIVLPKVAIEVREWRVAQLAAKDECQPAARGSWLELLQALCFRPKQIVDVGANRGGWSRMARRLFPLADLVLVDGNNNTHHWNSLLRARAAAGGQARGAVAILDREERMANWYTHGNLDADTGASLLKEQTAAFADVTAGVVRRTQTLDGLLARLHGGEQPLPGMCDLLKLDVQGAELRVLQGATRCLARAEAVLLELSVAGSYNLGAPSFAEHVAYLDTKGFSLFDVGEQHRMSGASLTAEGLLFQLDLLFVRKGGRFIHAAQTVIDRFGSGRKGPEDDHEVALVRKRGQRQDRQGRRRRG